MPSQLPRKLSNKLDELGADSIHVSHYLAGHLFDDVEIKEIAIEQDRIIVSKDIDFHNHFVLKGSPPRILLLKVGNISNKDLLNFIDRHYPEISSFFEQGSNMIVMDRESIAVYK
ncbi:MAG: DUF5615 family PIN-like protein [Phaeodactylibacter sp.]|nr:DUF5615 family PIN-like protein [Phaeodactylibacter sp.]MCB9294786.1 DUF5615 family PIN-like protein [Lewinellaceae bacterium]